MAIGLGPLLQGFLQGYNQYRAQLQQAKDEELRRRAQELQEKIFNEVTLPQSQATVEGIKLANAFQAIKNMNESDKRQWLKDHGYGPEMIDLIVKAQETGIANTEANTAAVKGQEVREQDKWGIERQYLPTRLELSNKLLGEQVTGQGLSNEGARFDLGLKKSMQDYYDKLGLGPNGIALDVEGKQTANKTAAEELNQLLTRGKYLEPQLKLQLDTGTFNLEHAKELAPSETATAKANAEIAGSDARVAEATEKARIEGAKLETEGKRIANLSAVQELNRLITENKYLDDTLRTNLASLKYNLEHAKELGPLEVQKAWEDVKAAIIENQTREPRLKAELDTILFNLEHSKELAPYETATAKANAEIAGSDARVANATEGARIKGAELEVAGKELDNQTKSYAFEQQKKIDKWLEDKGYAPGAIDLDIAIKEAQKKGLDLSNDATAYDTYIRKYVDDWLIAHGHQPGAIDLEVATKEAGARSANVKADIDEATKDDVIRTAGAEADTAAANATTAGVNAQVAVTTMQDLIDQLRAESEKAKSGAKISAAEAEVAEATKGLRIREQAANTRIAEGKATEQDLILKFLPENLKNEAAITANKAKISFDEAYVSMKTKDARVQEAENNAKIAAQTLKNLQTKVSSGQPINMKELMDFGLKIWNAQYGDPKVQLYMKSKGEEIPDPEVFSANVAQNIAAAMQGKTPPEWVSPKATIHTKDDPVRSGAMKAAADILARANGDVAQARSIWLTPRGEAIRAQVAKEYGTTPEAITEALSNQNQEGTVSKIINWVTSLFSKKKK
ncbi:MAG: hypothetical protein HPY52_11020 [Firmicutes bacterium]|nr:hypothetical protein [Bacillota bacterium]